MVSTPPTQDSQLLVALRALRFYCDGGTDAWIAKRLAISVDELSDAVATIVPHFCQHLDIDELSPGDVPSAILGNEERIIRWSLDLEQRLHRKEIEESLTHQSEPDQADNKKNPKQGDEIV